VVVSAAARTGNATALPSEETSRLVWHELECGGYEADLALWRTLAGARAQRVLEVGAGAGRVSLDLARAGHAVTALDHDRALLSAVESRRGKAAVQTAHADARSFSLPGPKFGLCVVPMHTIQLLSDAGERAAFLRCARKHLRRGGLSRARSSPQSSRSTAATRVLALRPTEPMLTACSTSAARFAWRRARKRS